MAANSTPPRLHRKPQPWRNRPMPATMRQMTREETDALRAKWAREATEKSAPVPMPVDEIETTPTLDEQHGGACAPSAYFAGRHDGPTDEDLIAMEQQYRDMEQAEAAMPTLTPITSTVRKLDPSAWPPSAA